jgi:hypothetical protein
VTLNDSGTADMRRMQDLLITFDGTQFVYNGFRYDRLTDAVAYAELMRSRPTQFDKGSAMVAAAVIPLSEAQLSEMVELGIERRERYFHFAGYRYDRLADAVNYARSCQPKPPDAFRSAVSGTGGDPDTT